MLKLLIVDDEALIRESLSEMADWNSLGYELAGTCQNGIDALDFISDEYPDVVITDLKMPVLDGLELIERTKKLDPHIRFIILSGYGEFEYAKTAMKFGVRHYLLKPTKKAQVLEALSELGKELSEQKKQENARQLFSHRQTFFLIQRTFYTELLNQPDSIQAILKKYQPLFETGGAPCSSMICSYLNDACRESFLHRINAWLQDLELSLFSPVIYLRHVAILIFDTQITDSMQKLGDRICQIQFINQKTSPDVEFASYSDLASMYHLLIPKILRYSEILLCQPSGETADISDNIIMTGKINVLSQALVNASSRESITVLLDDAFHSITSQIYATAFSGSLFLRVNELFSSADADTAKYFFEDIIGSSTVDEIKERLNHHLAHIMFQSHGSQRNIQDMVSMLKQYINEHLDSDEISLKYLAENQFYVSVGYLSKQFLKLEGKRFSDYLNYQRMEKAKKLMATEFSPNIQLIAEQVGFGNNPRYFSQVFKKYTGMTPSDYLEAGRDS